MNFIKEGVLIPTRNCSLFTSILVLNVACAAVAALPYAFVIWPLGTRILCHLEALSHTHPRSYGHARLMKEIQANAPEFLIDMAAYLLSTTVVSSAVSIVSAHAAVATSSAGSEGRHGLRSLLASVRGNLRGPFMTALLSNVLPLLCAGAVAALVLLVHPAATPQAGALEVLFLALLIVLSVLVALYLSTVLCSMAIVVSVAEPGCHGAGAFRRALQLAAAKNRKGLLFMVVQSVATAAIWTDIMVYAGLLRFVYVLLLGAVQVVSVCAVTAYYYECKLQIKQDAVAVVYAKVQTDEANNV